MSGGTKNKFGALASLTLGAPVQPVEPEAEPVPTPAPAPVAPAPVVAAPVAPAPQPPAPAAQAEPTRMLAGRLPNSMFQELQRRKLDAEATLGLRSRVTTEEALEALLRLLRTPELETAWQAQLMEVRKDRRE